MIKFLTLNLLKYFDFLNQSKVFKFLKKKGYKKLTATDFSKPMIKRAVNLNKKFKIF